MESSLRNAEVLQALGMTENLLDVGACCRTKSRCCIPAPAAAASRSPPLTRFSRQAIQILMLALGAYLVLTQRLRPACMIATTIILGRAVQPVEQLVGSWRMLTEARAAYRKLARAVEGIRAQGPARLSLPRPEDG